MVKLSVNLAIAIWLFASAFVLPQSTVTAWDVMIVALVVAAAALMMFVTGAAPGSQVVLALAAIWLFASTMILPHESLGTVLHDALIACVLGFVTLMPTKHWAKSEHAEAHAH